MYPAGRLVLEQFGTPLQWRAEKVATASWIDLARKTDSFPDLRATEKSLKP